MSEVIIDGVNVAECQYYFYEDTEKAHTCRLIQVDDDLHYICKDNPNCYFKQLKRLEAKHGETVLKMAEAEVEIEKLQAENEKLRDKAYKDADMIYRLTEENREYDIDLSIEKEAHKSTIERLDKYHKALEDIREILCYGRTFYDGYFDSDKLSRTDEAIKRVNEVLYES